MRQSGAGRFSRFSTAMNVLLQWMQARHIRNMGQLRTAITEGEGFGVRTSTESVVLRVQVPISQQPFKL